MSTTVAESESGTKEKLVCKKGQESSDNNTWRIMSIGFSIWKQRVL